MTISGDPDNYWIKLLLSPRKIPSRITVDGTPVNILSKKIELNLHVIVNGIPSGEHVVMAEYK